MAKMQTHKSETASTVMTLSDIHTFWGEATVRAEARKAGYLFVSGLILGMIAPYDSSNVPILLVRYLYWVSLALITSVLSGPVARLCLPPLMARPLPASLGFALYTVAVSVTLFPFVVFTEIYLSSPYGMTPGYIWDFLTHVGAWDYVPWFGQVALLTALNMGAITLVYLALHRHGDATAPVGDVPPSAPVSRGERFLARLPAHLGSELLYLSMEDHYLRVVTREGNALILLRMRDALTELEDYPGFQVHRSHWVAEGAIEGVKRDGRRYLLTLRDGRDIPVSRSYIDTLRTRGYA